MESVNKQSMRIVFLGTPDFAVASLEALIKNDFNVVGVITAPDKPAGRGYKVKMSAVKVCAESHNIPVLQPTNLKDPGFLEALKALQADIQIVVAFRMLPEAVWNMPEHGTFNLHASLLPQYRGAAPINWAVINGEKKTGVTTFFLKHEIDTGAIIDQESMDITSNMTAGDLHDALMELGSSLVVSTMQKIVSGQYNAVEQVVSNIEDLKSAPKLNRKMARINWDSQVENVYNFIRGLSPFPGAWTMIKLISGEDLKQFKIFTCSYKKREGVVPGKLYVEGNVLEIGCTDGVIIPELVQLEGKKRMSINELLNGVSLDENQLIAEL